MATLAFEAAVARCVCRVLQREGDAEKSSGFLAEQPGTAAASAQSAGWQKEQLAQVRTRTPKPFGMRPSIIFLCPARCGIEKRNLRLASRESGPLGTGQGVCRDPT